MKLERKFQWRRGMAKNKAYAWHFSSLRGKKHTHGLELDNNAPYFYQDTIDSSYFSPRRKICISTKNKKLNSYQEGYDLPCKCPTI